MGAESGKKKLIKAEGEYAKLGNGLEATSGFGKAATDDEQLDESRHDRSYNPIDQAEKGSVSAKLNGDSGRYRKGPGPM
jgi:hypothetical protein